MHAALKPLIENRWLEEGTSSPEEVRGLLGIVERRMEEAQGSLKYPDTIFILVYDAVLAAATAVLRAHGVRAKRERHHEMTFRALREVRVPGISDQARYYDECRRKRNTLEYDSVADVSNAEAADFLREALRFTAEVRAWLEREHPELR
jgi:uncharacterized protein (UPF0332 family)